MCPLADSWRVDASVAYIDNLQAHGLSLEVVGHGHLRIPPGHTPAEFELVRLLKPELLSILKQDAFDLAEGRAEILESVAP